MLLRLYVTVQVALVSLVRSRRGRVPSRDHGQTTAEYALVLVGVAAVALLLVAWASNTDAIGRLLDGVLDSILDQIP